MTMMVTLSSEKDTILREEAKRRGIPAAEYARELLEGSLPVPGEIAAQGAPNEGMLVILQGIEERHQERPFTDGSDTRRLLREARAGAMYGLEPGRE